ncbi:MAG: PD-(D/E)XK nuclease family protein [Saprospiraceae bacterium]|nr:PD-(D/E)XK nuclease family protein [Saprospiraceae bacterium]
MKAFSISGYRTFQKCQWQWYFMTKAKSGNVKNDPYRREITMLSHLRTLASWRGQLVDDVLSNEMAAAFNQKQRFTLDDAIEVALRLFEKRLHFSQNHEYRDVDNKKSHLPEEFSPLLEHEYDLPLSEEQLDGAWLEIEIALTNFFQNEPFVEMLRSAEHLDAQRTLNYKLEGFSIIGTPDLIVYSKGQAPLIVDWKVHAEPVKRYNQQLLVYALGLHLTLPQNRQRANWKKFLLTEYRLVEYQLLKNDLRYYPVTEDYLNQTRAFIIEGAYRLQLAGAEDSYNFDDLQELEQTDDPENCLTCCFRKICNHEQKPTERQPNLFDWEHS